MEVKFPLQTTTLSCIMGEENFFASSILDAKYAKVKTKLYKDVYEYKTFWQHFIFMKKNLLDEMESRWKGSVAGKMNDFMGCME